MGSPSREDDAAAIARRIVEEAVARAEARETPASEASATAPDEPERTLPAEAEPDTVGDADRDEEGTPDRSGGLGAPEILDDVAAVVSRIVAAARAAQERPPNVEASPDTEPRSAATLDTARPTEPVALTPPPASPPPGPLPPRIPTDSDVPGPSAAPQDPERTVAPPRLDTDVQARASWRWLAVAVLGAVSLVVLLVLSSQALRDVLDLGS